MLELLRDPEQLPAIRKEALWLLSNVAVGTAEHVQELLDAGEGWESQFI